MEKRERTRLQTRMDRFQRIKLILMQHPEGLMASAILKMLIEAGFDIDRTSLYRDLADIGALEVGTGRNVRDGVLFSYTPTAQDVALAQAIFKNGIEQPRISAETKSEVVRLHGEKHSLGAIARRVGISKQSVANIVKTQVEGVQSHKRYPVTQEQFVEVWQAGESVEGVARQLGMTVTAVTQRAIKYRKMGVLLKLYRPGTKGSNWKALTDLAEATEGQTE